MLKFKKANLLESFNNSEINIIAIICNCTEGMKYGIAKDIAKNFPTVDNFDKFFRKGYLGKALSVNAGNEKYIFNLYSQYYPDEPNEKKTDNKKIKDNFNNRLKWFESALEDMVQCLDINDKIGISLSINNALIDKELKKDLNDFQYFSKYIQPIIIKVLNNYNVTIYYS